MYATGCVLNRRIRLGSIRAVAALASGIAPCNVALVDALVDALLDALVDALVNARRMHRLLPLT